MPTKLKVGDRAPEFNLPSSEGRSIGLKDFLNKKHVVLYFYPKDNTPGCTKEGCSFRDYYEEIKGLGAEVLGVSFDSVDSHKKFASKHGFPFPLLSDKEKDVAKAYGAIGFGGLAPKRITYIIDKEGIIRHIYESRDAKSHVTEAIKILKEISGP